MAIVKYKTLKECYYKGRIFPAGGIVEVEKGQPVPSYFTEDLSATLKEDDFSFYETPRSGLRLNNSLQKLSEIEQLRSQANDLGISFTEKTTVSEFKKKLREFKDYGLPK